MVATVRCPHCSGSFEVPSSFLGQDMTCLTCSKSFLAPKMSVPPPATPRSPQTPAKPPPPTPPTPPTAKPRGSSGGPPPPQPKRVRRPPRGAPPPRTSGPSRNLALWLGLGILAA